MEEKKKKSFFNTPSYQILPLVQPSLNGGLVNTLFIRRQCAEGLSESPDEDRALAWLVLLGVYPRNAIDWPEIKHQIIQDYKGYVKDICHLEKWHTVFLRKHAGKKDLNVNDKELMFIIHNDISRTNRMICFFPPRKPLPDDNSNDMYSPFIEHSRRLERILYVFATVNHSLYYMQGFNELLSPLYYALCKATELFQNLDDVEALAFRCLQELLTATSLSQFYTIQDQSSILFHTLNRFNELLAQKLPDVYTILKRLEIQPLMYSYRWFNILFAHEHDLPNLLIVWDSLFAHIDDLIQYLFYVAIAHLRVIAPLLDPNDSPNSLQVLHNMRIPNIYPILQDASQSYDIDHGIVDKSKKYRYAAF